MIDFQNVQKLVVEKLSQLNPNLTYHCLEHTLDVLEQCKRIASDENITNSRSLTLLKVAALYHDTGFLHTYSLHETKSCEIFLLDAKDFDLTPLEKQLITDLIMVTQIPQLPKTLLQKIICDADLDYLGRDDFFSIGDNLRQEFLYYKVVSSDQQWDNLQVKFLQNHSYHTRSSQKLREPVKQSNISKLPKQTM